MNGSVDYEIVLRDPEKVLRKHLKNENLQIVKFEYEPFTKVGDNYGSTMLKVRVVMKQNDSSKEEELNLVAKMLPPTKIQREMFESPYSFKKEIFLYKELIPMLDSVYGKELDVTPKFYGSRMSLNDDDGEMDENAMILMENLKAEGYYMEDRHKGLDKAHLTVAIRALAKFHAVGLAAKRKITSFLADIEPYTKKLTVADEKIGEFYRSMLDTMKEDCYIKQHLDRVVSCNGGSTDTIVEANLDFQHPFACIVHKDLWNNNIVVKIVDGKVDSIKMVDFQTYTILSPLTDLVFFLCTSTVQPLSHMDEMLELYRQEVISILKELSCDSSLFSKDRFDERLREDARSELSHIILMSKVVELRHGENIENNKPNEYCMARIRRVVEIYVEKNWM